MISPQVRRLRLGRELLALRRAAELTTEQLGKRSGLGRIAITRLETAVRRPDLAQVLKVLDALEVTGDHWNQLVAIARDAAEKGWWEQRAYSGMGASQARFADREAGAATIRAYHPLVIPGLLQTEPYIRSRVLADDIAADAIDQITAGRLKRQRMVARDGGPQVEFIVEEVVVRRVTAAPAVMREQLERLVEAAAGDGCFTLRVVPVDVKLVDVVLPVSAYTLYTYPDQEDPTVVAIESEAADFAYTKADQVAPYERLWTRLAAVALSPRRTVELLTKTIERNAKGR